MEKSINCKMKNRSLIVVMFLLVMLAVLGCEDDPLLAPQSSSEDEGGSYGNLSIPGSDENSKSNNPEVF